MRLSRHIYYLTQCDFFQQEPFVFKAKHDKYLFAYLKFVFIDGEPPRQDTVWLVPFSLSVFNVRNGNFLASLDQTWVLFVILYKTQQEN